MPANRQPGRMPEFMPGEYFSVSEMNRLADEVRRGMNIEGDWPIGVTATGTGYRVQLLDAAPLEQFYAKITAVSAGKYSWTEQFVDAAGAFMDNSNGRAGTAAYGPAYERNSYVVSSFPFYALLTRRTADSGSLGPVYDFDVSGAITAVAGSLTVEEEDGVPSGIPDHLIFPNDSLNATSATTFHVRLADYTHAGMVDKSADQWLGSGRKGIAAISTAGITTIPTSVLGAAMSGTNGTATISSVGTANDTSDSYGLRVVPINAGTSGGSMFVVQDQTMDYGDFAVIISGNSKACFAVNNGTIQYGIDTSQAFLEDLTTTKTMTIWGGIITDIS